MKMKVVACLAFLLNTVLFSTYYAVAKEALGRIDPILFTFFEMMALVPLALCIIVLSWPSITRQVIKRGIVLGSTLCLALFTIAIALKYTSATSTAFFPALNGFLAAFVAWLFLRQPITKATWFAGLLSVVGAALLIMNSAVGGVRGSLIAFLGGFFFTSYVFVSEHEQKDQAFAPLASKQEEWPLFGIELLTMAAWASLVVLLFGDWQSFHPALPKDIWVILYVAGACTFLPVLITVLMQKYISAVTISFIYILEPVLGAVVANVYLHEALSLDGYIGGGLIVVGALIHTWSVAERPSARKAVTQDVLDKSALYSFPAEHTLQQWRSPGEPSRVSLLASADVLDKSALYYPLLFLSAGIFILYGLGGFPPHAWSDLYHLWPVLSTFMQQGQDMSVFFLVAPTVCWLIAWASLALMALLTVYRVFRVLLFTPREGQERKTIESMSAEMSGRRQATLSKQWK